MAGTSIVQRALDNRWLAERAVPSLKQQWIEMHYGQQNELGQARRATDSGTNRNRNPASPAPCG
jgi:hypothetical protein